MDAICPWETDIAIFQFAIGIDDTIEDEGKTYKAGEFIDICIPDYWYEGAPYNGMTLSQCVYASKELNRGTGYIGETTAKEAIEKGFGWLMWFAYAPQSYKTDLENLESSASQFNSAARGAYDQGIRPITHYYKKQGENQLDPVRYEF